MPDYSEEIKKTGFILENTIVRKLKAHSWNIISNKYYEDDIAETVREIDILAYKVGQIDDIRVYTALLISCKKSEENTWALICRDIDLGEPNSNWWPLHVYWNDTAIQKVGTKADFSKEYYNYMHEIKSIDVMGPPLVDIFAFQEMNKGNGKPQNDKNIFTSITTLMKAQAYEIGALNSRTKHKKRIYQFNLLSIIDSDLVKLHLDDSDNITETSIDSEQMVARYIIRKQEQFFRIRFIKASAFDNYIDSFDSLHEGNLELFKKKRDEWLLNSVKDHAKLHLLHKEFFNEIKEYISTESQWHIEEQVVMDNAFLVWEGGSNKLRIFVTEDSTLTERLSVSDILKERTKFFLKKFFHYEGEFYYSNYDLPF